MDLTEIMDFLDSLDDNDNNTCDKTEDKVFENIKALKRIRANTWHGDDPFNEDDSINEISQIESLKDPSINNTSPQVNSNQTISRKSIARRNAWGNLSYADLITQAINSTNDKRMTLSEIYNWMVQNIPFFRDKGESNSSAGWKNSIRHNLSLHNCFMRVQNDGAGKSSWWVLNPDYRVTRPQRRRANTMDPAKTTTLHQRRNKTYGKKEQLNSSLADSTTTDISQIKEERMDICEELVGANDLRPRSKTFSTKFTKLSPTLELEDQEDNDQMHKRKPTDNQSGLFFMDINALNNQNEYHQSSHQPYHPTHFIPIPSSNHQAEIKCGSLLTAWDYKNNSYLTNNNSFIQQRHYDNDHNNHSMNNIKNHMYTDNYPTKFQNDGNRLLSGGSVKGPAYRRPTHNNFYNRPFNNHTYLKKYLMENSTDQDTPKNDSLSGNSGATAMHSWQQQHSVKKHLKQEQFPTKLQYYPPLQHSNKHFLQQPPKDHALLLHLLTDKDHQHPQNHISDHHASGVLNFQEKFHPLPFNSPPQQQQYPSMLQHLLTGGHKCSPPQPTFFHSLPELEPIHPQYRDPNNNVLHKFPVHFSPHQTPPDYTPHPSMQFSSSPNFNAAHMADNSPIKTYSDEIDSPPDQITSDQHFNTIITPCHNKITPFSEIPEDLVSLDSLFSSDLDNAFDSPGKIEKNISQVINLERSLGDPLDLDFVANAFHLP